MADDKTTLRLTMDDGQVILLSATDDQLAGLVLTVPERLRPGIQKAIANAVRERGA